MAPGRCAMDDDGRFPNFGEGDGLGVVARLWLGLADDRLSAASELNDFCGLAWGEDVDDATRDNESDTFAGDPQPSEIE